MDVIDFEIEELHKICANVINNSKIKTCTKSLIRIDIKQTESRQITVCIRFPTNYPSQNLLLELKSRTLSGKLLDGLTTLAEQNANEFLGKPQTLNVLKFIDNYLRENPLCIVFDEIASIKSLLKYENTNSGELKCRQKSSSVMLTATGGDYYFKTKIFVPEEYPIKCISWTGYTSNLPITLLRFLNGQAKEIARKCVEAPSRMGIERDKFVVKPSLQATLTFLIEATVSFHNELCPVCECKCLPSNASSVETDDTSDNYVERVYCGHIYHLGCLKKYLREPPFPPRGKLCPAKKKSQHSDGIKIDAKCTKAAKANHSMVDDTCHTRLSHDRWGLSIKLAEARWAQQQARKRELEEVIDFLK